MEILEIRTLRGPNYWSGYWKKLIIMAGGIAMNLLIAFGLLWGVYGLHGTYRDVPVVRSVQPCYLTQQRPDPACTPAVDTGLRNTPEPTVRTVAISRIGDPAIRRRSIARSVSGGTT